MIQMLNGNSQLTLGERLCNVRQDAGLTQRELAERTGLTQTQICRIEMGGRLQQPSLSMLKVLAEGAQVALSELVNGTPLERLLVDEPLDEDSGQHVHYCPNPFCTRNKILSSEGRTYRVRWTSLERVRRQEFSQIDFCGHCGRRLVKVCPHCGKRIRKAPEYFCCRCGNQIHEGPSAETRTVLKELFGLCTEEYPPLMTAEESAPCRAPEEPTGPRPVNPPSPPGARPPSPKGEGLSAQGGAQTNAGKEQRG
jgi:transcriptional regulator with XRE-family HTH domain